ncbi:MAG: hypothetical protein AB1483_12605 [Candidatus Zixiibacteriota bacterium]
MSGAAGGAAAAAAARKKALVRQEEEDMTRYSSEDLEGWEFKIIRAVSSKFKKPSALKQLCAEEAKNGWEMIEKFDDSRVRFKRKIEHRSRDQYAEIDPYRTRVGIAEGQLAAIILGAVFLVGGLALLLVTAFGR